MRTKASHVAPLVLALLIPRAPVAHGGAFPHWQPVVRILSPTVEPVPRNARVRIYLPDRRGLLLTTDEAMAPLDPAMFALRAKDGAGPIEVDRTVERFVGRDPRRPRDLEPAREVELRPRELLAPNTRYEIVAAEGERTTVLGELSTSASELTPGLDDWRGIVSSSYVELTLLHWKCDAGRRYFRIVVPKLPSQTAGVRYLVWLAKGDGPIDGEAPPATAMEPGPRAEVQILFLWLDRKEKIRIGVRAVDVAGHRSPLRETVLDARRLTKRHACGAEGPIEP